MARGDLVSCVESSLRNFRSATADPSTHHPQAEDYAWGPVPHPSDEDLVKYQDMVYTLLSGDALQVCFAVGVCAQRSTAVDRWAARSISRTMVLQ